jgi:hypothetical protein
MANFLPRHACCPAEKGKKRPCSGRRRPTLDPTEGTAAGTRPCWQCPTERARRRCCPPTPPSILGSGVDRAEKWSPRFLRGVCAPWSFRGRKLSGSSAKTRLERPITGPQRGRVPYDLFFPPAAQRGPGGGGGQTP